MGGGQVVVEFFSPIPAWAQRRLDMIGHPVPAAGTLFAYRMGEQEWQSEKQILEDDLWLSAWPLVSSDPIVQKEVALGDDSAR